MKKYLFLAAFCLLVGCGQEANGNSEISKKINEELGITPYLPEVEYPIANVNVEYTPVIEDDEVVNGDPWNAVVQYNISLDEKVDEDFIRSWEENNPRKEIIYGELYKDPTAIIVNVNGTQTNLESAETIEIEGHKVQFQHIERESETVIMLIDFEDINYKILYFVDENDIQEEAKAFAKEIINNY
ncbi:hypothetical protein [Aquisalibacillus elongatus]|uniref:DUF4367 domain-containing protein n=1 Tax=Aquisalibacillus elongatus TaxID=485577 RepID=A0A3N5BDW0_9BACI|nr:hypothetical protein [Aquisalibacillus elongatus]RPF55876.1 hypothetical protein EDC24_0762 [Aquisalibacillus elongatus]